MATNEGQRLAQLISSGYQLGPLAELTPFQIDFILLAGNPGQEGGDDQPPPAATAPASTRREPTEEEMAWRQSMDAGRTLNLVRQIGRSKGIRL